MRLGFLKCLLVTLFALVAPVSFGEPDPPPPTPAPAPTPAPTPPTPTPAPPPNPTHVTMTREEYDRLVAGRTPPPTPPGGDPPDPLRQKVKNEQDAKDKQSADARQIESALQFTMGLDDFVKKNTDLLPTEIVEIVRVANAEKYDSAAAKAAAVKVALLSSYFSVQANVDSLTEGQRRELDDYMKLTKNGREEKATTIYANIFEPSLEMNRRLKKAEELRRGQTGVQSSSGTEANYRDRMIAGSRKKYLGK